MAQDTLYLKIEQNVEVHTNRVYLRDIAQITCSNKNVENRAKALLFPGAVEDRPGRYVKSVMEIIECLQKEFPNLDVNNIGEADFIITYEKPDQPGRVLSFFKTACVTVLSFFGASFSIMTFNNDVDVTGLFGQVYELFTGQTSDGFTILELMYSLGLGIGILVFFNHFAGKKFTEDPTPLEVQMRTYEDDVNATVMEASRHMPPAEKKNAQAQKGG